MVPDLYLSGLCKSRLGNTDKINLLISTSYNRLGSSLRMEVITNSVSLSSISISCGKHVTCMSRSCHTHIKFISYRSYFLICIITISSQTSIKIISSRSQLLLDYQIYIFSYYKLASSKYDSIIV